MAYLDAVEPFLTELGVVEDHFDDTGTVAGGLDQLARTISDICDLIPSKVFGSLTTIVRFPIRSSILK